MSSFQTGWGWLALQGKLFPRSRSSFPWALFFPSQVLQGNEDSRARNWLEKKLQWNCPALKVLWILYDILCDILWPEICTLLRTWNVQRIAMPWNSWAPKLNYILWSLHWQNRIDLSLLSRILPSSVTLPPEQFFWSWTQATLSLYASLCSIYMYTSSIIFSTFSSSFLLKRRCGKLPRL